MWSNSNDYTKLRSFFVTFPMKTNCSTDITIFRRSLNWECYLWRSKDRTLYRNFITKVLLEQILLKQCHSDQNNYRFPPLCKIILFLLYLLRRPLSCNYTVVQKAEKTKSTDTSGNRTRIVLHFPRHGIVAHS